MGIVGRRFIAVAGAGSVFAASWWICARFTRLDTGSAVGVAGAVLAVAVTVLWWWATRESSATASLSAEERLRRAVISREDEVRKALLDGLIPANLAYSRDTPMTGASFSDMSGSAGFGGLVRRTLNGLLRYDIVDTASTRNDAHGDLDNIGIYFAGLESKRLVVLGRPGAGKTVLAIELVLQLLRQAEENPAADVFIGRIPVRFSVASWLPGQDLRSWLMQRLALDYGLASATAQDLIDGRRVLPVLDGLDELDPEPLEGPPRRALALLNELNSYAELGQRAPVVVTCREERYEQITKAGHKLAGADTVTIRDLDTARLRDYLHARYADNPQMYVSWDKVLDQLNGPAGVVARRVLTTPWRLLLSVTAAENGADPGRLLAGGIGEDPGKAERRIAQTLLASYIPAATRLKARPGRRTRHYRAAKVERWMCNLAGHLAWQADQARSMPNPPVGMTEIDIVPHLLWPIGGLRLVRRLHATLGLLTGGIYAAVAAYALIGSPSAWAANISRYFHGGYPFVATIVLPIGVVGLVFGLPLWMMYQLAAAWPVPKITARTRDLARVFPTTFAIGFGVFFVAAIPTGLLYGFNAALTYGATSALVIGLASGLLSATRLGEDSWLPTAFLSAPMSALSQELTAGLMFGVAGVFTVGLPVEFLIWRVHGIKAVAPGVIFGLTSGLMIGLIFSISWGRYIIGRAASTTRRSLPPRLGSFLTWACESGLLRVSGATYQFRHRELQDWLYPPDATGKGTLNY